MSSKKIELEMLEMLSVGELKEQCDEWFDEYYFLTEEEYSNYMQNETNPKLLERYEENLSNGGVCYVIRKDDILFEEDGTEEEIILFWDKEELAKFLYDYIADPKNNIEII